MKRADVGFLLLPLPGFALLPFGGFLDKLRFSADDEDLSQQRYCRWQVLGHEIGACVAASCGVEVKIQTTPEHLDWSAYQYLVIFGAREAGQSAALATQYRAILRQANQHGLSLVSIDNACFLLAQAGFLKNHQVAVHWRHAREFAILFPNISMSTEQLYLLDGKRISCAGGSAAIDLATELLSRHCGREKALKGLADMLVDETRETSHRLKSLHSEPDTGRHLSRALALMRQFLGEPMSIDALAAQVGVGRRQLDRLFMAHFDLTARAYWQEMRLKHLAWRLRHSHHSLSRLADEVGMTDVGYMGKVFKNHFGMTPKQYRGGSH